MTIPSKLPSSFATEEIHQIEEAYQAQSPTDFNLFANGLKIPSSTGPQLLASCIADHQVHSFSQFGPSLESVQQGSMPPIRRFWMERTKKASKDADLAICIIWLIAFAQRPLFLQVAAADRDQAAIVKRRMEGVLFLNKWLEQYVNITQNKVTSTNGLAELEILAADIAGSHGETPDVLIVNELSHIVKWEFVENLMDNADGVPQGVVIIATNAGFCGTKAEVWRTNAIQSDMWDVHIFDKPAPWITKENLIDAKKRNSPSRYKRLWKGTWVSGKGDALDEDDIAKCFDYGIGPIDGPIPGWVYIAGLDLGITHDHAALVVVGVNEKEERIRVASITCWEPGGTNGEVDLISVEKQCFEACRRFGIQYLGYDPTEARLMAQRLSRRGAPMRQVSFSSPSNLTAMAEGLIQVVEAGKLECFDDEVGRLRRDFGKFMIVERGNGYKLEAIRDEYGHADVGVALVITLPRAISMLGGMEGLQENDVLWSPDDEKPWTEDEIDELPDGMRDIFDTYDDMDDQSAVEGRDRDEQYLDL